MSRAVYWHRMEDPSGNSLRIGDWCVNPAAGQISQGRELVRVEARALRLLLCLAEHAGEVVSVENLLNEVWAGVIVTPDSVYQCIATLRRVLRDDARQPRYIATVPRLGYRMVARVSPWSVEVPLVTVAAPPARRPIGPLLAAGGALCLALVSALLLQSGFVRSRQAGPDATVPPNSVAVLPFLDLTSQAMDQEFFADGMTEELIDRLSKIPTLHVTPPTSSFYFKDKNLTVREMASSLGVAYIVDGSLRKSASTLRIAARLVRASDGFVVWSEALDRPVGDELKVQDDIAGAVTQALAAAIH